MRGRVWGTTHRDLLIEPKGVNITSIAVSGHRSAEIGPGQSSAVLGFRRRLISWGRRHFRGFPWRLTADPYRILLAEVMLHRTQRVQVAQVYRGFVQRYPDAVALGKASRQELQRELGSLGLHWRIDLIHEMAAVLGDRHKGRIPRDKSELSRLPGVGDYIAGAVRCLAWNLPEPLLDTNTVRVVGRLFGLEQRDSSRRNRTFRNLLAGLIDPAEPRAFMYSLLDLADEVCTAKVPPACEKCPVWRWCVYAKERRPDLARRTGRFQSLLLNP
jgi:A/G-specific adenine glycosylase